MTALTRLLRTLGYDQRLAARILAVFSGDIAALVWRVACGITGFNFRLSRFETALAHARVGLR